MESAQAWEGELGIFSDEHKEGLAKLACLGEDERCLVIPQLFHGGFRCPRRITGVQPVSASEFQITKPDFEIPRALSEEEIFDIKSHFVAAAQRAIDAGLPGVEIHGANGYLFTQFLSPETNRRNDKWGGSLENRARFLLEVTREIRTAIGPEKILGIRISPENTKLIGGIDIDEMKQVACELNSLGADYISLSLWDARKRTDKYGEGGVSVVEQFRKALPSKIALIVSGKIWTHADARQVLELGADSVALGAAAIANPSWPHLNEDDPTELKRLPLTRAELHKRGLSDRFIDYLERWSFVS